jgi:hypothetical protein
MKALNSEAGEQVLAEMVDKKISIPDGLAKLAVLSGQYDYRVEF